MTRLENLPETTFYCRTCDEYRLIYALGTVVNGPRCPNCRKPMGKLTIVQTHLKL
jgi:hypothetical protein